MKGIFRTGVRNLTPNHYPFKPSKVIKSRDLYDKDRLWELPTIDNDQLDRSESAHPFGREYEGENFLQSCEYTYREDFVCEIDNIRIIGPNGVGITNTGEFIADSITIPQEPVRIEESVRRAFVKYPLLTLQTLNGIHSPYFSASPSQSLEYACLLHSKWNNYYHWLIEHLPKIRGVRHYEAQTRNKPTLIIPNDPPPYVLESLKVLNIDTSACVEWNPPAIDVDTLVLPAYPEATPENLRWLRRHIQAPLTEGQHKSQKRIYISRGNAQKRKISNENQIEDVLDKFGFKRVLAEDFAFTQQVKLFSNAEVILGPHGAGLTNMIWANNAKIIELHNNYIRDHYYILANNLGHNYQPIQGRSIKPDDINSNLIIDPSELRRTLSRIV
ncbi:hypothetical protein GCM10008995_02320 [Halobellus salinus]|uniref:Glycosyltransferase 61 catalytic domain-containing protein n=1 Tax=Halobellus salinus TaxID=931585 RepID=A0A830EBL4_9EURY|nr:glycosyltransferase family 61 protein [Halobellus salinus]GGI95807.1 hypothetical protein GCM10008995_02320 [Halobellus salinus]